MDIDVITLEEGISSRGYINSLVAKRINQNQDNPFYFTDLGYIFQAYRQFTDALPNVTPFYAVKSNPDMKILKILNSLCTGFDCASKSEINLLLDIGALPSQIVYSHPKKMTSSLAYARSVGVDLTNFDTESELNKIKRIFPTARLLIRIFPVFGGDTPDSIKFGCRPNEIRPLLAHAKKLELDVVGVCFHVGLGKSGEVYQETIKLARKAFNIGAELGFQMKVLDIGGGMVPKLNGDMILSKHSFQEVSKKISETLDQCFPLSSGVKIIAEPGSFFSLPSGTLVTNILSKLEKGIKAADDTTLNSVDATAGKDGPWFEYFLNESAFGAFSVFQRHLVHPVPKPLEPKYDNKPRFKTLLFGQSCSDSDVIDRDCLLPEMEVDDWLIFEDMGGYCRSGSSTFNGFQVPENVYFITNTIKMLAADLLQEAEQRKQISDKV